MTLANALQLVTCHKHKQALATIATKGYIMDDRMLGRNTAYAVCKSRGYTYNSILRVWLKL